MLPGRVQFTYESLKRNPFWWIVLGSTYKESTKYRGPSISTGLASVDSTNHRSKIIGEKKVS